MQYDRIARKETVLDHVPIQAVSRKQVEYAVLR